MDDIVDRRRRVFGDDRLRRGLAREHQRANYTAC
jgi:hypothetical protein